MKKALTKLTSSLYHYVGWSRVEGPDRDMVGDCSGLRGDCSGLSGNCSYLRGNCSCLRGNCSGLYGDCSNIWGDLDDCGITDEDRKKGIDIQDLIKD